MQLILTEKPSAAESFSRALGGFSGMLNGDSYQIVASSGKLFEFKELSDMVPPERVSEFTSRDISSLPFDRHAINFGLRYSIRKRPDGSDDGGSYAKQVFSKIHSAMSKCDVVIIATDTDPSGTGDLLAWDIINQSGFGGKVLRCRFPDEEVSSLQQSLLPNSLEEVSYSDPLVQSCLAQSKFDYYTIQYSRITSYFAQSKSTISYKDFITEGRFKSVAVKLIGDREKAYESFVPSSVYELSYKDSLGRFYRKKSAETYASVSLAMDDVGDLPSQSSVKFVSSRDKHVSSPPLYDYMSLSGAISKAGHDTKHFKEVYQKMYDDGVLKYPRTDDRVISQSQLDEFKKILPRVARVVGVDMSLLDVNRFNKKNLWNGKGSAPAHGANRPGSNVPNSLDDLLKYGDLGPIIYDVVSRIILSSFCEDKLIFEQQFSDLSGEYIYTYNQVKSPGFDQVLKGYEFDETSDDAETNVDSKCPVVGEDLSLSTKENKATRPKLFTETSIAAVFAKLNLGTGATRKSTLDQITYSSKHRKLVNLSGRNFRLSNLGLHSFYLLEGCQLSNPQFTLSLLKLLSDVKTGSRDPETLGTLFDRMITYDLAQVRQNLHYLDNFKKVKSVGYDYIERTYLPTNTLVRFRSGILDHRFSEDELNTLCSGGVIKCPVTSKSGQLYYKVGHLGEDAKYGWGFVVDGNERIPLPTASGVYVPSGETITFERCFMGSELSDSEVNMLLDGHSIPVVVKPKSKPSYRGMAKLAYADVYKSTSGEKSWQVCLVNNTTPKVTRRFVPGDVDVSIPSTYMRHKFSESELNSLFTGDFVSFEGTKKDGDTMPVSVSISYGELYGSSDSGYRLDFYKDPDAYVILKSPKGDDVSIPRRILNSYTLTDSDLASLSAGGVISFPATSKAGNSYDARMLLVYSKPYNSSSNKKTWHLDFEPRKRNF